MTSPRPTRNSPRPYRRNTAEKFWSRVDRGAEDECWPWQRPLKSNGYGQFKLDGKAWGAHRLAYVLTVGEPPAGLVLDHLCRNRACCNPAHMEPVTNAENVLRGIGITARNARATECSQGHAFDERNTAYVASQRICKTCRRARSKRDRAERAELIKADPSLAPHGVLTTYSNWRCRCAECKSVWSDYMRAYHQRRMSRRDQKAAA